jgi:DNA phosphorothioation-dependent restriction protein DptH
LVQQIEDLPAEAEERTPLRILFGNNINNGEPVYWYPTDTTQVMHSNTGIIGTMGTGKTQFTKSVVTQLYRESKFNIDGKPIGLLIFDYKGDYINDSFVNATNARVYGLYDLPFNPLAIDVTPRSVPLLPLHIASTLQETISLAFNLGNKQKALLKDVIMKAYEDKGIIKTDPGTWNRMAPTIAVDERMSMDSLYAALNQLSDYQIFQPNGAKTKSLYELIDGVTVINLSGGYSADIQNLVVAITLDAFYSQMQKNGHSAIEQNYRQITKMILVDEADNFLSKNFVSIRKILKEGREFGVGTLLSTQFLNHFSTGDNEYAQYILTWIVHRVNDIKQKDVESLFPVSDKDQKEQLMQMIKKLEKHHSVVNLAGSKPIFIEDYPFWQLVN